MADGIFDKMIKIINYLIEKESAKASLDNGKAGKNNS
jgi:hypothetical protein